MEVAVTTLVTMAVVGVLALLDWYVWEPNETVDSRLRASKSNPQTEPRMARAA